MDLTRRDFIKLSGAATGFLLASSAFDLVKVPEALADFGPKVGTETTSICCCCACGCGMLITTENPGTINAKVINVEGDPTHPTNEGGLCSKCISARDTVNQVVSDAQLVARGGEDTWIPRWPYDKRAARVLWRPSGSAQWKIVTWTAALQRIASLINTARGTGFQDVDGAITVNRMNNLACLGGAAHDNQECYLLRKLVTSLGIVFVEHQARI